MNAPATPRVWQLSLALVALIVVFRLLPHPPNFTPTLAVALLCGVCYARLGAALAVPAGALLLSDLVLGGYSSAWGVYLAVALCVALGRLPVWRNAATCALGATAAATLFFLLSNFAVWWSGDHFYAPTAAGLLACYVAAVPFFHNTLLSTLAFSLLFFLLARDDVRRAAAKPAAAAAALALLLAGALAGLPAQAEARDRAANGLWRGSFDINGRGSYDFTALHLDGRVAAHSAAADVVYRGRAGANGDAFHSNLSMYIRDGGLFGVAQLRGAVADGARSIRARYRTSGGDAGALTLRYDALFERAVSLAQLSGDWQYRSDSLRIDLHVSRHGDMRGTDSVRCIYQGSLRPARPGVNAFHVALDIRSCRSIGGRYAGLLYLDAAPTRPGPTLQLNVTGERFGLHYPLARTGAAL